MGIKKWLNLENEIDFIIFVLYEEGTLKVEVIELEYEKRM